jgi:hypothetical protein
LAVAFATIERNGQSLAFFGQRRRFLRYELHKAVQKREWPGNGRSLSFYGCLSPGFTDIFVLFDLMKVSGGW